MEPRLNLRKAVDASPLSPKSATILIVKSYVNNHSIILGSVVVIFIVGCVSSLFRWSFAYTAVFSYK